MKTKFSRLLLLVGVLALIGGCQNTMDYGEIANLHDSAQYRGPTQTYYDSWYGGGAYMGAGGYGGVGIGISVPVVQ
jgi:hypothetical protein